MDVLYNPRARLADAEKAAREYLRTNRVVPGDVLYVRADVGYPYNHISFLSSVERNHTPPNAMRDEDYEFAARRVYETTVSYFFVRKASKNECVASALRSRNLAFNRICGILLEAGCPLYEEHVRSLRSDGYPTAQMGILFRKRLDVLWLFWSVVPANAFSNIVKHFFR